MDEMKKFFEAIKDEFKKDIAAGQQEMRTVQDEMKVELKASLTEEIKREPFQMKEKLSTVESKQDSIEVQVYGIEKNLGKEITDIK